MKLLDGKVALVLGVANVHSIAAGCAQAFAEAGAEVALTYVNAKAKPYVPLDVEAEMDAVFAAMKDRWGRLDTLVHSIAFCAAEDRQRRVTDFSPGGFAQAMDISVHSRIRMARLADPLMTRVALY